MTDAKSNEALLQLHQTLAAASKYLEADAERTTRIRQNLGLSEIFQTRTSIEEPKKAESC